MTPEHAAAAGGEVEALRNERNHWIGEAHRYERLYHMRDKDATNWFKRMRAAEEEAASTRQAAADAVLAEARRIASAHHVASAEHGRIVALGERLARAARGAK